MNEEADMILARYFSGEATKKERQTLDKWLAQSEENEKQFHEMSLLYQYVGQKESMPVFDTEKALSQFQSHIHEKQPKRVFFLGSNYMKVAAAAAVLLVTVFSLFYFFNPPSKVIRIMAVQTSLEYKVFENTTVILTQGSEIVYHTKKENEITLKGKATFKVDSKTLETGILVQAGETFIKDIGTIFTVDASQPDKLITVEVSEGEVWFYTENNAGVYLKQNESASYDVLKKQFEIIVETIHAAFPSEFVFNNTPLVEAIEIIKNHFGADISIHSKTLNGLFLNASFDVNESLENILEIIAETFGVHLLKDKEVYILFPSE
jgi:ferric-dicitrate binding protein FerR (iron transport regulator)